MQVQNRSDSTEIAGSSSRAPFVIAAIGAVSAMIAVGCGAFGAHGLRDIIPADQIEIFETGARYQMYHALGLFGVAWLAERRRSKTVLWAAASLIAGTVVFSGSLYALALSGVRALGAITPIGGVLFLLGWLLVAWTALRR